VAHEKSGMTNVSSSSIASAGLSGERAATAETRSSSPAKPRTLLFVTNTGEYGGAEKHLLDLIRRLIGPGAKISILCLQEDLYTGHLSCDQAAQIKFICYGRELQSFWEWYRVFRDLRPDVVVFVRAWLWCYRWHAPVAAWLAGIPRRISIAHLPPPVLLELRGGWFRRGLARVRRTLQLLALRVSANAQNAVVCVSDAIRGALIRDYGFPASKTITIPNGISLHEFDQRENRGLAVRERLGLGPQEFVLVCVARLSEQKRIDVLLLSMAKLLEAGVECKCIILGDGPLREDLLRQAASLKLTRHVFFEGFQEDVQSYLQAASAFVLTSDREGGPIATLEAMACGLPCVVTDVGWNAELVTNRVHGFVVARGSADEVAAAVSYLAQHPHERLGMSKMSRARIREGFDIEDRMANLKDVILGCALP